MSKATEDIPLPFGPIFSSNSVDEKKVREFVKSVFHSNKTTTLDSVEALDVSTGWNCVLNLREDELTIQTMFDEDEEATSIPLHEIVGVKLEEQPIFESPSLLWFLSKEKKACKETKLLIHIYTFYNSGTYTVLNSNLKRQDFVFECCKNKENFTHFFQQLKKLLFENDMTPRPRKLVVIQNPIGGNGKGIQKYKEKALPIFEMAEIDLIHYETKWSKHAQQIASSLDLQGIDGIVCVGGDGIIFEVINGLMEHPNVEKAKKIPIGIIPTGSQNALSVSSSGTADPLFHAVCIAKGFRKSLDLTKIHFKETNETIYSSIFSSFGYVGDIAADSVNYRWMGSFRYIYCGGKQVLSPQFRRVRVRYLPENSKISTQNKPEDWKCLETDIVSIMICNVSCANTQLSPLAPNAELTDGCLSIVLWKKCNRVEMLNYGLKQQLGQHGNLRYCDIFKVKSLKLEPLDQGGPIDIDGEVYQCTDSINFEILPSVLTLFCQNIAK